jgi:high affinity Mn2+ porin
MGLSLQGGRWSRPDDTVGLGFARNDISRQYKNYLNAGGLGVLVGDGQLPNSGPETLMELYYSLQIVKGVHFTADYQFINNPAYNRDRGPVSFLGGRLHAQF